MYTAWHSLSQGLYADIFSLLWNKRSSVQDNCCAKFRVAYVAPVFPQGVWAKSPQPWKRKCRCKFWHAVMVKSSVWVCFSRLRVVCSNSPVIANWPALGALHYTDTIPGWGSKSVGGGQSPLGSSQSLWGVGKVWGGGQSQGEGDKVGTSCPGCLYHTTSRCFPPTTRDISLHKQSVLAQWKFRERHICSKKSFQDPKPFHIGMQNINTLSCSDLNAPKANNSTTIQWLCTERQFPSGKGIFRVQQCQHLLGLCVKVFLSQPSTKLIIWWSFL